MTLSALLRRFRPLLIDTACAIGLGAAVLAPTASHAAVISQTIEFESIAPFGTFTDGTFTLGGWSSAFPVNGIDQVSAFHVEFTSNDPRWLAELGPLGGTPKVEFSYRDDADVRHGYVSMGLTHNDFDFDDNNPVAYQAVKQLLADGNLTVTLGGFENFPGSHTDVFTFGKSWLTLSFELPDGTPGDVPGDVPGPGTTDVPEPHGAALAMTALLAAAIVRRRRGR